MDVRTRGDHQLDEPVPLARPPTGSVEGPATVILTGPQGSGKTTACLSLVRRARQRGLDCAGIICPARLESERKVGIDILDVRTGERRFLAAAGDLVKAPPLVKVLPSTRERRTADGSRVAERPPVESELRAGPYYFDQRALAWGAARLRRACPCDVLIVDEIGPLEMERAEGWANAIENLCARQYRLAVAVVRPSLVEAVRMALGGRPRVVHLPPVADATRSELNDLLAML